MLLLCLVGMGIGLAIDCASTPPAILASLCLATPGLLARVAVHWTLLPATHVLMLVGALIALAGTHWAAARGRPRPTLRVALAGIAADGACLVAMLGAMVAGAELAPLLGLRFGLSAFVGMIGGMAAGMIAGMALTAPLRARPA